VSKEIEVNIPKIYVENLILDFGKGVEATRVLHGVDFSVVDGESFGLVGESGSGKTTVLRCIAGQYGHWSGSIRMDGKELEKKLTKDRCRLTQMVFQDPYGSLHPKQTIYTALMEPLAIHKISGDRDAKIADALENVGLDKSYRWRYPHQLSGGQRQRVAIARALILEPRVLLLDEPTSALDVSIQAEILNLLAELQKRKGLTYILVSHDLGVVAHLCDRMAVMQAGRILETLDSRTLADIEPAEEYTKVLLDASREYGRKKN
jgi:peptide/nickel transport system ATP-binding protein